MPTKSNIKDVARRAGVSTATVSHVLNNTKKVSDETRRRVVNAIEGLQYHPDQQARSLRTGTSQDILILADKKCMQHKTAGLLISELSQDLQKYSHTPVYFYDNEEKITHWLQIQNFSSAYIICFCPNALYWDKNFNGKVNLINMEHEELSGKFQHNQIINACELFYQNINDAVNDPFYSHVIMNYQQANIYHQIFPESKNNCIRFVGSEFSSASSLLQEFVSDNNPNILFADYTIFAGAIKYLLQHEELLGTTNLSFYYYSWDKVVESYGLPLFTKSISPDILKNYIMEKLSF